VGKKINKELPKNKAKIQHDKHNIHAHYQNPSCNWQTGTKQNGTVAAIEMAGIGYLFFFI